MYISLCNVLHLKEYTNVHSNTKSSSCERIQNLKQKAQRRKVILGQTSCLLLCLECFVFVIFLLRQGPFLPASINS